MRLTKCYESEEVLLTFFVNRKAAAPESPPHDLTGNLSPICVALCSIRNVSSITQDITQTYFLLKSTHCVSCESNFSTLMQIDMAYFPLN